MTTAAAEPASNAQTRVICACFDVTDAELRRYFANPDASIAGFVQDTGISTKCTACKMDFELLLETVRTGRADRSAGGRAASVQGSGQRDLVDSGFLVNSGGIRTVLRLDNSANAFDPDSRERLTDYACHTRLVSENGRVCRRRRDELPIGGSLTLDFASDAACPELGWFWVWLRPKGGGYFGSTRPQFALVGPDWVATVHTQPHALACRRKSVIVQSRAGRFNTLVSIVNGDSWHATRCELVLGSLADGSERRVTVELPANGSRLADLDGLFQDAGSSWDIAGLTVYSDRPVRKHIVKVQPNGQYSIDHFPSVK